MSLIAGLGNPGNEYAGTRHNIGFELIDRVAESLSISLQSAKGSYLLGEGSFNGSKVYLVKPLTFMNRSGAAVKDVINRSGTPLESALVCYDDINLPPGALRLRPSGSAGGHNGLGDIIRILQTDEIPRLRIGIGNNFDRGRQSDYVLSDFTPEERTLMNETLTQAEEAVLTFIRAGIVQAMNLFN